MENIWQVQTEQPFNEASTALPPAQSRPHVCSWAPNAVAGRGLQKIPLGFLVAKHVLPNSHVFQIQGVAESLALSPHAQLQHSLSLPLSCPFHPSWSPAGPLLQGEIGHHPFSPLGTRNPCVSLPVKGLPSPEVTQKSMVWLQPVTASTGRASVRVYTCTCVHACVQEDVCVHACACMPNAQTSNATSKYQGNLRF